MGNPCTLNNPFNTQVTYDYKLKHTMQVHVCMWWYTELLMVTTITIQYNTSMLSQQVSPQFLDNFYVSEVNIGGRGRVNDL